MLGGAPRVGVSARLARTALAEAYGRDVSEIEEIWHALEPPYLDLFAWLDGKAERPDPGLKPVFRPVMLAHPVEEEDWPKLAPATFSAATHPTPKNISNPVPRNSAMHWPFKVDVWLIIGILKTN